jgi:Sua5/YciO/YrdC/YwlC family protein
MKTAILDVSGLTEERLRQAQVLKDKESEEIVRDAMAKIQQAAEVLQNGGLVAFPTETVYGIGADAFNEEAVGRVYEAKGRPSDNPMIVHIARASDICLLSKTLSPQIVKMADAFWPGPLTMVLEKKEEVPLKVTGGLSTVGVRLPDNLIATELIRLAGRPVAAPSANISGSPSPTKSEHVIADLDGKVDVILAGSECRVGIESTVIDMTTEPIQILRPGIVTIEEIEALLEVDVKIDKNLQANYDEAAPRAPGMKYKHYAPKAMMLIVEGEDEKVRAEISRLKSLNEGLGQKVGVLLFNEHEYLEAAHDFYSKIRSLDDEGVDLILAGALPGGGSVGFAVMNRMMKAAGYNIVRV